RYQALAGEERARYVAATSYHTVYVMAFLCAAALASGSAPPAAVLAPSPRRSPGCGAVLLRLLGTDNPRPRWRELLEALSPTEQDAAAPLLLAILLRRARTRGDLDLVRRALEAALEHGLAAGPSVVQAAALLRRGQALQAIADRNGVGRR